MGLLVAEERSSETGSKREARLGEASSLTQSYEAR